jgi:hypothetical protein
MTLLDAIFEGAKAMRRARHKVESGNLDLKTKISA